MSRIRVLGFLIISQLLQVVSAYRCPSSFYCGKFGSIAFPFTTAERPDCGVLPLHGCNDRSRSPTTYLELEKGRPLSVEDISEFAMSVSDSNLSSNLLFQSCEAFNDNFTLPPTPLASFEIQEDSMTILFRCKHTLNINNLPRSFRNYSLCPDFNILYDCPICDDNYTRVEYPSSLAACSTIQLPISSSSTNASNLFEYLTSEFQINVQLTSDCEKCFYQYGYGGPCQLDKRGNVRCGKTGRSVLITAVIVAVGAAVGVAVVMILVWFSCFRKRYPLSLLFTYGVRQNPTNKIIEDFLNEHGHLPTRRYTYSEIKEATNSFTNKLGQGGYGSVYKGKLQDGCHVAVKVLSESKGNGEEFINEVASISRTSHVNIVSLLGFCFEGSKRALIYEFMPNGSLEKFIYEENAKMTNHQLNCKTLYNIAIGVARGLEYLHGGCNTKILHMDIKPHNILLDKDFLPKISDFGLAKICQRQKSFVSIFGVRGTVGYIAPEVFSRNFGGVSHKSDVYSYGMMILEMVGARKNVNVEADCSSEIYFPHWIYKCVELNQELELWCVKNEIDRERVRKMVVVGLWCIQTDPKNRPAMSKVIEMLEGSIDSLEVPPKPYLTSPPASHFHHSIQTS